ncbi:MAG: helix-hairpin-helix domain-containing protein [Pirellulales bacterium]|nr:helix-hairpin-helix domain-containing protein [Pirellulales bacterium]
MADSVPINLQHVAQRVGLPLAQVQAAVELLDEGNTVPFITRYRRDQTGGLDEERIRQIQAELTQSRLLAERKQTILRSIESQGKLTEELAREIREATTTRRLEDLYLPFKPKKQTLATQARARGLEELAREILVAAPSCADLDARAADFISEDRKVLTAADALLGAGHILAEEFSERADLRQALRDIFERTGKLTSKRIASESSEANASSSAPVESVAEGAAAAAVEPTVVEVLAPEVATSEVTTIDVAAIETPAVDVASVEPVGAECPVPEPIVIDPTETDPVVVDVPPAESDGIVVGLIGAPETALSDNAAKANRNRRGKKPAADDGSAGLSKAQLKKKQAQEKRLKALADYFDYEEAIRKIPPHRVLAINRGERTRVLRVKVEADAAAVAAAVETTLIPSDHPHAAFLRGCARDALTRLVLPSLEREVRRELTDKAEAHAVEVFARNLRHLLLQPPIHDHRVLAVDPGYRSGCKLVALDQFGNVLDNALILLVGKSARKPKAARVVAELVDRYKPRVIVIGNGTACRETESFFAELIEGELKDRDLAYVIVNEAGASVYSTSRLGREEFPHYDATLRGAISIGRRLQDPLSELVKIDPPNIGVGLYQHDIKAKHLRDSLDGVVESCVNFVGVNVNTASPALLRYVAGMNQLTARRVYEHRMKQGPFRNRAQLREVAGLGDATFVQAAGFLKIVGGDQPLDATWIHPESYEAAGRVLSRLDCTVDDLRDKTKVASLSSRLEGLDLDAVAAELQVGRMLLEDIVRQFARPGRDPREDLPAPVFKHGVLKLENLAPGMELTGTVLNVVDFGAFVDIGMHDSGLVHVSQLANRFVPDPHDVVAVGDVVRVWVLEVNKERRRVSLTMIPPGTKKPERPPQHRRRKPEGAVAPDAAAPPAGARRSGGARPPAGGQRRPPRPKGPPRGKDKAPARHGSFQMRPKSRPVVPITEKMKAGAEPMRTFGDLAQFFQYQQKSAQDDPPEEEGDQAAQPPANEDHKEQ